MTDREAAQRFRTWAARERQDAADAIPPELRDAHLREAAKFDAMAAKLERSTA